MSHPDPCYDPDNSYEEDGMASNFTDYHYDYHDDFFDEDSSNYHPDADHEIESQFDDVEDAWYDDIDDNYYGEDY